MALNDHIDAVRSGRRALQPFEHICLPQTLWDNCVSLEAMAKSDGQSKCFPCRRRREAMRGLSWAGPGVTLRMLPTTPTQKCSI